MHVHTYVHVLLFELTEKAFDSTEWGVELPPNIGKHQSRPQTVARTHVCDVPGVHSQTSQPSLSCT